MKDGSGAEVDVEGVPEVTGDLVEEPAALVQGLTCIEAHGTEGDEGVGQGQGYYKVISPCSQLPVPPHCHNH